MSRTIRRLNYEREHRSSWTKGHYSDRVWFFDADSGHGFCHVDVPMDAARARIEYHELHRESKTANERSPSRVWRRKYQRMHRTLAQRQLHAYSRNPDHEPVIPSNPQECWTAWS